MATIPKHCCILLLHVADGYVGCLNTLQTYQLFSQQLVMLHCLLAHYLIHGTNFGEDLLNKKCVFRFLYSFTWNSSHSQKNLARYYNNSKQTFTQIIRFLLRIHSHLNLLTDFRSLELQLLMKIRQVCDELLQADRRTDSRTDTPTKQIVPAQYLANASKDRWND